MPIRRGVRTVSTISGSNLAIDITHTDDSIRIGDGTNLMSLQNVGGTFSFPTKVMSTTTDAVLTGGTAKTKITDGTNDAQVDVVGADKALKVSVISAIGGLAFSSTDGSSFTPASSSFMPIGGQYDADDSADLTDGKQGTVRVTAERAMHVYIKGSDLGSSGGTSMTDDAAFTVATSSVTPIGAMCDETATDSVDEGDVGVVRMTADRQLYVKVGTALPTGANVIGAVTQSGTWNIGSVTTLPNVTNGGTFAVQDSQVIADNAGFTDGTSKVFLGGYIYDEVAGTALTENDAAAARINVNRAQVATIEDGATRGRYATVTASNAIKVDGSGVTQPVSGTFWQATQPVSGTFWQATQPVSIAASVTVAQSTASSLKAEVVGPAAHDAGVSGNPVRVAGRAMLANGTAVAEDDVADIATDNQGRVVVTPHVPRDLTTHATVTLTSTSETTLISAGAAGVFHDITKLIFTNSSATATRVAIKDSTSGTTRLEVALAANGGAVIDFGSVPMCQATAANHWTVTLSGAVTSIYCYGQAIKRIA